MAKKKENTKVAAEKADNSVKLVKMERDGLKADVHPDMVDEYKAGGYKEAK